MVSKATVWLTAAELADRLRIKQATLWQWKLRGKGPTATRIGGRLLYDLEGVEAYERAEREQAEKDRRRREQEYEQGLRAGTGARG